MDTVAEEDWKEELCEAKDFKIPIYNTEDGISLSLANLGAYGLIFIYRVGYAWIEVVYHTLWSGWYEWHWVIDREEPWWLITGDKGKGDAELFNSLYTKYESCWNKKWAAGLTR